MRDWAPFVVLNMTLIISLGTVLWVKFHTLRVELRQRFAEVKEQVQGMIDKPPPILLGEAFLSERFERLEKEMIQVSVRLEEIEKFLSINGGDRGPRAAGPA